MKKVISVRFKDNGKTYYFDPADTPIKTGDIEEIKMIDFSDLSNMRKFG